MTRPPLVLLSILLLGFARPGVAQPPAAKPILSAEPTEAPPPIATVVAPGPASSTPDYVIGADDQLQITVWKEPNLSATLPVRPDGKISLSLVGDIPAAGETAMQLSADITTRLKKFITDPVVDVSVQAVNSKQIFFIGEIGHVGPLAITPGMTILQAIASAGGPSRFANRKHIYILRGAAGSQQKIPFDYTKALKKGDMQGVSLVPGDTIVVP
jgi:polysaccharide export outer membrane protein